MAEPTDKTGVLAEHIDVLSNQMFGRTRTGSIRNNVCVSCGGEAIKFKDALSKQEYRISGLCMACQNKFGG